MPELPEVETVVRGLRARIIGGVFSRIEVGLKKSIRRTPSLAISLKNKKILAVDRRGKNIIIRLSGGLNLLVHLGMSGRLRVTSRPAPREKHTHVVFSFRGTALELRFVDPRQFGRIWLEQEGLAGLAGLGPEPLEVSFREFTLRIQTRRRVVKPLLLDQRFLAGIGNIYADEALHRAGIHPRRLTQMLDEGELGRLHRGLRCILRRAIKAGGTSVRTYVDAAGSPGAYQNLLRAYGREGEPCKACGTSIVRERVGGRSSFFCPQCQPFKNPEEPEPKRIS